MRLFDDIVEIFRLKDLCDQAVVGDGLVYFSQESVDLRNKLSEALATARRYASRTVRYRVRHQGMSQRQADNLLRAIWS